MILNSQQYANLAGDSYNFRKAKQELKLEGVTYKVLEHIDNEKNGYQGTIYQRIDTGEIVVAHRGTEPKHWLKDGVITDGAMVLARTNIQANDANELTRRALEHAKRSAPDYGNRIPQVTVTGHSLGGCLAQIIAYKFNLKGETFNAYGAVSLGQGVPEGGNSVINHVMAGDPISPASQHYGQVRVYTLPEEIRDLQRAGYGNTRNPLEHRNLPLAAAMLADSHSMHRFLNVDGDVKPDKSILADPHARQLAAQFDPMIDKYRNDVAMARGITTVIARGPYGAIQDGIDALRESQLPGELARRAERVAAALPWHEHTGLASSKHPLPPPSSEAGPYVPESIKPGNPISLPDYLTPPGPGQRAPLKPDSPLPRNPQAGIPPHHPDYALYTELKQRLPPETSEDRLAQITVAARMGGVKAGQLDGIHINEQSLQVFVSGSVPGNRCCVNLGTPPPAIQETLQRSEAFDQQQAQQLAQFQAQQQSTSAQAQGGPSMNIG